MRERLGLFHQLGDYLVAALLLTSLARAQVVAWPLVLGLAALANAAMTRGPLAAFRSISLRAHRIIEMAIVCAAIVGAVFVRRHGLDAFLLVVAGALQFVVARAGRLPSVPTE